MTNWAAYDSALRQRGSLTVWFTEAAIAGWKAEPRATRGGQPRYSELALEYGAVSAFRPVGLDDPYPGQQLCQPGSTPAVITLSRRCRTTAVDQSCPPQPSAAM